VAIRMVKLVLEFLGWIPQIPVSVKEVPRLHDSRNNMRPEQRPFLMFYVYVLSIVHYVVMSSGESCIVCERKAEELKRIVSSRPSDKRRCRGGALLLSPVNEDELGDIGER
jgi:hypothetical protein